VGTAGLLAALAACQGAIERPAGPGSGAHGSADVEGRAGAGASEVGAQSSEFVYACRDAKARGSSDARLRRLTQPELTNTLTTLLGREVMGDAAIQTQLGLLTQDRVIRSIQDVAESPADSQPSAQLEIALRAAELVTARDDSIQRVFGSCASVASLPEPCLRSFVTSFGAKLQRRPLTTAESDRVIAQYQAADSNVEGMRRILARLLMAPSLTFHLELGSAPVEGRVRLTDYEVAARLAYRLTGNMPDAALLAAAADGSLRTLTGVRKQAERLVSSPDFRTQVTDFFRFYAQLYAIPTPHAFVARLDEVADPASLGPELAQETLDFIDHVVWTRRAGFRDLLSSRDVFPRSARMAKILETSQASGTTPVQTSVEHAGLVLRPSFLADPGLATRPYHRALRVRADLLCESFGLPDPKAIAQRREQLGDVSMLSSRERLGAETDAPVCRACHGSLNPVAFVLEGYDQLGMRRTVESVFDDKTGTVLRTHAIDTHVTDTFIRDAAGPVDAFEAAPDLVSALAAGNAARACFARRVFEFQRVRPEASADACALREVEELLAEGGSVLDAFVASVANEDIFYKAEGS
jgi:hypothetical protein